MLRTLLVASQLLLATHAFALAPAHLWSRTPGGGGSDTALGVALDAVGNIVVVGSFSQTVNFGGTDLVSAGGTDILVAKYTRTGEHLWSKRFGDIGNDEANAVAVDASGTIYVAGSFGGTVDFGGGVGLVSAGAADIFVAKYTLGGVHSWSVRYGSFSGDEGLAISIDASNAVLLTGYFQATVDFGGGGLLNAGGADVFVAKYNSSGSHLWSKSFGSANSDLAYSVTTDVSSNVIVTGEFTGTVNFGGASLVSAGGSDVFVAKYNSSGTHQWSQRFGSTSTDKGASVAVDASGNVVLTGSFVGTVNFGGSSLLSAGGSDIFLAKYTSLGVHQWSQRFGGTAGEPAYGVDTDVAGSIFLTGVFQGSADFGGGALVSAGSNDIFVAKYNSAGAHQWSRRAGGTSLDDGRGVAVDNDGDAVNVGRFFLTADVGDGPVISNGSTDMFIAKYSSTVAEPDITAITDIGNDQGRKVQIKFVGSGGDNAEAAAPITSYEAYRRQKSPPASSVNGSRAQLLTSWTFVGSVPAHGETDYTIEAATIGDSTVALGQYRSTFFIRAASDEIELFYDSPPDSGYSLDNLAPGVPLNFVYESGGLEWDESSATDFDFFTVYGSNTDAFGASVVVDYSVAPSMDVTGSPYLFYFVTATDFAGNEGKPAKVNALTGVGGTPSKYVLSVSNYPNPFNPRTTVSYTVPSRGEVTIAIYDARGARVATLVNHVERAPGAYIIEWDGRTDAAAVAASGIYFARIEHASGTRTKKMVLVK